jgi:hypothetical protein
MPRLSTADYLLIRQMLYDIWHHRRGQGFQLISTNDQRSLHAFFRPSEDLTEAELLEHRQTVSNEQPSLPQCTGRALRHFANPLPLQGVVYPGGPGVQHRIVVYPLLRPKPDLEALARIVLRMVHQDLTTQQPADKPDQDRAA